MNKININLNNIIAVIVSRTLEFSGVEKSKEELESFCENLSKDEDLINALRDMISIE